MDISIWQSRRYLSESLFATNGIFRNTRNRLACRVPLYSENLCRYPMEATRQPSLRWSSAIPAATIFQICGSCLLFLRWSSVIPAAVVCYSYATRLPSLRWSSVIPTAVVCYSYASCLSFLRQSSDVSSYGMNCSVSHRCAESRLYEQFRRILEGYHHEEVVSRNHSEERYQHKRQTVKPVCYG